MDSSISTHFILFESDFVNIASDNYSWVETANSKVILFIVTSGTVLIEHEIFDPKKKATNLAISKLWPVYYITGIQMCFLSTRQIL